MNKLISLQREQTKNNPMQKLEDNPFCVNPYEVKGGPLSDTPPRPANSGSYIFK